MIETIRKEILAGLLIGIGGFAFLSVDNKYIGAFLFSVGLISVILLGASLYTGKVGYVRTIPNALRMIPMCLLNMLGAALVGIVTQPLVRDQAVVTVGNKLMKTPLNVFISAVICGALIYLAVELYKRSSNILTIIIPVFTFVAVGADHCIANAYYFVAAGEFTRISLLYLVVCVFGNATGSLVVSLLQGEKS